MQGNHGSLLSASPDVLHRGSVDTAPLGPTPDLIPISRPASRPISPLTSSDSAPVHRSLIALAPHSESERSVTDILIVDDHVFFAEMLDFALRSTLANDPGSPERSPRVVYASSATEGLRLISEDGPFDLVVVDLILPDRDGTEVVREIKAQSPGTLVAVLSASQDLSEALAAGADEAISKRLHVAEIVASLVRLVEGSDQPHPQDA
jgi:CheY-like chemotaxis protein